MVPTRPTNALLSALAGDTTAVDVLYETPHDRVVELAAAHELILTRDACVSVLNRLLIGDATSGAAQRWAAFVRRGFAPGGTSQGKPIRPLDIDYELGFEDQIADVISRLDEIGDLVDGQPPTSEEVNDLIATLAGRTP